MGYTTDFSGSFSIDRPLDPNHAAYLRKFNETRRMKRDESVVKGLNDDIRKAVNLPVGKDGGYFVGGLGYAGQDNDVSVVNHNAAPEGQPGLWCQWTVGDDDESIVWDEGEKFYDYVEWLKYIITHFLEPWGYKVNGLVRWRGEDFDDMGKIIVCENEVSIEEYE